ncbi:hypothetical protein DFS34DRAFT_634183 [Phlyctochytrium arcticum]|nr:hypothetical protein DFS34DRAFT_634183 [Phlyctochytrium arcticum]
MRVATLVLAFAASALALKDASLQERPDFAALAGGPRNLKRTSSSYPGPGNEHPYPRPYNSHSSETDNVPSKAPEHVPQSAEFQHAALGQPLNWNKFRTPSEIARNRGATGRYPSGNEQTDEKYNHDADRQKNDKAPHRSSEDDGKSKSRKPGHKESPSSYAEPNYHPYEPSHYRRPPTDQEYSKTGHGWDHVRIYRVHDLKAARPVAGSGLGYAA